ncbi:MAG: hypothetical protein AAFM92_08385 [Pseudomonadota bacterium]
MYRSLLLALPLATLASLACAQNLLGDNDAFIDQLGDDNAGAITQTGAGNQAGLEADVMLQDGQFNALTITQTGIGNAVGTEGEGLFQLGRQNTPTVFNQITITQAGNGQLVGEVDQQSVGSIANGANEMVILQNGGDGNVVSEARQLQASGMARNIMDITQTGEANRISLATQLATSDELSGAPNTIRVRIVGSRNGQSALRAPAIVPFARDSAFVQEGGSADNRSNGNSIDVLILGNDTAFGIRQGGRDNDVGFITIEGDFNDLGIRQDGDQNTVTMTTVEGSGNVMGIDQLGTNTTQLSLIGFSDDNLVSVFQQGTNDAFLVIEGDANSITVAQNFLDALGGDNSASIEVRGTSNAVDLTQEGQNTAEIVIEGSANNAPLFSLPRTTFEGVMIGSYAQRGFDNRLDIGVIGDSNVSTTLQAGDLNSILLRVSGDDNEALLLQRGNANTAHLTQRGTGNTATIRQ